MRSVVSDGDRMTCRGRSRARALPSTSHCIIHACSRPGARPRLMRRSVRRMRSQLGGRRRRHLLHLHSHPARCQPPLHRASKRPSAQARCRHSFGHPCRLLRLHSLRLHRHHPLRLLRLLRPRLCQRGRSSALASAAMHSSLVASAACTQTAACPLAARHASQPGSQLVPLPLAPATSASRYRGW